MVDNNDPKDTAEPTPQPNTGASVPQDMSLSEPPLLDQFVNHIQAGGALEHFVPVPLKVAGQQFLNDGPVNAPGDDSIRQAEDPLTIAAGGAAADTVLAGARAAAPVAARLMADEVGGVPGVAEAKAMMEQAYAKLQTGEITKDVFTRVFQQYNRAIDFASRTAKAQKYADGGEVAPVQAEPQTPPGLDEFVAQATPPPGSSGPVPHGLDEFIAPEMQEAKYGTTGQMLKTGLEGAASAATFGLSTKAETALGVDPKDIVARREANPGSHMVGQVGGLLGSALLPGAGAAGILARAGEGAAVGLGIKGAAAIAEAGQALSAAKAAGTGVEAAQLALKAANAAQPALAKVGSAIVKGFAENALFQSGDEVSKMFSENHPEGAAEAMETAMTDIGISGLIGAGISGTFGTVAPLWKATVGPKVEGFLKTLTDRVGGIENASVSGINESAAAAGVHMPPEVAAGLSDNRTLGEFGKTLEQRDTTSAGKKYQEAFNNFREHELPKATIEAVGRTEGDVIREFSPYEHGKNIGNTLADEFQERVGPLGEKFEARKAKFGKLELPKDEVTPGAKDWSNPYQAVQMPDSIAPGTVSKSVEKIAQLSQEQGWTASMSSDIMRNVNRVIEELPKAQTVEDLTNYIKAVGDNMQSDAFNGPLKRAGSMIKEVLQQNLDEVIGNHIGKAEGATAAAEYNGLKKAWADSAKLQEAINERFHIKGSTSSFAKNLKAYAQTDGEAILRKVTGKTDADLFNLLKQFPKTEEAVRNSQLDQLLKQSALKAKGEATINVKDFLKRIEELPPETKDFLFQSPEARARLQGIQDVNQQTEKLPHNWSGTARADDKLRGYEAGSAVGLLTVMMGHTPVAGAITGVLTKLLSKDAPDAIKLALLKMMGSSNKIESGAFKASIDLINSTIKGENLLAKGTKNIFNSAKEVLPSHLIPSETDRERLEKHLNKLERDPASLTNVGGEVGHYLPNHATEAGMTAARVTNYLKAQKPVEVRQSPLDAKPMVSQMDKAAYNRTLDIAQQPLLVLDRVKHGTVTPKDIQDLQNMYPTLYSRTSQKLMKEMNDHIVKGDDVPYKTRMGLSLFLAQPLDSTMTPEAIQTTQMIHGAQAQQRQAEAQPPQGGSKGTPSSPALQKMSQSYQTPLQARQAMKLKGK